LAQSKKALIPSFVHQNELTNKSMVR
jgi:hypothetical protein